MNKSIFPPVADNDIGPLDEHGQQIWSPEEEAAIARLHDDPVFLQSIEEARAQFERGECYTTEEVKAHMVEVKRQWHAERRPN